MALAGRGDGVMNGDRACRVCGGTAGSFGQAVLLGRHNVMYFRCTACAYVQTERPYWLDEAYSTAIADEDIGLVGRNLKLAGITDAIIRLLFDARRPCRDFGGGYGLFVRLMRDRGYDFYWEDQHCQNLFARGFEAGQAENAQFELTTAFEVLEHLSDPVDTLRSLLASSKGVLATTEVMPEPAPRPGEWWYYAVEQGQHIGLFTRRSLEELANAAGCQLLSHGSIHLFTRYQVPTWYFRAALNAIIRRVLPRLPIKNRPGPGRTEADHKLAVGRKNARSS